MKSLIFKGFNFEILWMQILPGYAHYVLVNIRLLLRLVGQTVKTVKIGSLEYLQYCTYVVGLLVAVFGEIDSTINAKNTLC